MNIVYLCHAVKAIAFLWNEESPDSTEHRTGEEPGPDSSGTDSATENNRPLQADKGENVR